MGKPFMTMPQRRQLSAIRKLLRSADSRCVEQGIELLLTLNEPKFWISIAKGMDTSEGFLDVFHSEIYKTIQKPFQEVECLEAGQPLQPAQVIHSGRGEVERCEVGQ